MLEMPQFYRLPSFVFSLLMMLLFWLNWGFSIRFGSVLHSVWTLGNCEKMSGTFES